MILITIAADLMASESASAAAASAGWRHGAALLDEETQHLLNGSHLLIPSSRLFLRDVIGQGRYKPGLRLLCPVHRRYSKR